VDEAELRHVPIREKIMVNAGGPVMLIEHARSVPRRVGRQVLTLARERCRHERRQRLVRRIEVRLGALARREPRAPVGIGRPSDIQTSRVRRWRKKTVRRSFAADDDGSADERSELDQQMFSPRQRIVTELLRLFDQSEHRAYVVPSEAMRHRWSLSPHQGNCEMAPRLGN
jgi:hypothetical protein